MSFSATNVKSTIFGDLKVTCGDWTGSAGDAAGTVNVEGGRVYLAEFCIQDTDSPTQGKIPVSVSVTGPVATVTCYYHETVTTGRFLIIHS